MNGITGMGSLPHRDPLQAAAFVLDTSTLPYLPQLPHRHPAERMLTQWGEGLCGCGFSAGEIGLEFGSPELHREEAFVGAEALLDVLPMSTPAVKTQVTGPVTLALGMLAAGRPRLGLEDCLIDNLVRRVDQHLAWINEYLPTTEVIVFLDEPGLTGLNHPGFPLTHSDASSLLDGVLRALPVHAGIHCCGETDWSLVAERDPSWLSWDIDALGPDFPDHGEAVAAATARGTRIAWGVVPVQTGPPPADLLGRLQRAVGSLVMAGADMAALTEDALFTPACGLAGLTEGQAEAVLDTVHEVVGELSEAWAS